MWKSINSTYSISSEGLVRNDVSGKILTPDLHHRGYFRTSAKGVKPRFIHRLVALAFIPNPNNLPQVNHIDGNKQNNNVSNLEWCTNRENSYHYYVLCNNKRPNAKLSEEEVKKIKSLLSTYNTKTLANMFGVADVSIQKIKYGNYWKDVQ